MKKVLITLPFATITMHTNLEAGTVPSISDMPDGHWQFESEFDRDTKHDAFFYITPTDQNIRRLNSDYVIACAAIAIGKEIFENNFFNEKVCVGKLSSAQELREEISQLSKVGLDTDDVGNSYDVEQWVMNDGARFANKLIKSLTAEAPHPTHVNFEGREITDAENTPAALICIANPAGGRIHGKIYMGSWPEKAAIDDADEDDGFKLIGGGGRMPARLEAMLKERLAGILGNLHGSSPISMHSSKPKGEELRFTFELGGLTYTAVLDMPYKGTGDWFMPNVLEEYLAREIRLAISKINANFGAAA